MIEKNPGQLWTPEFGDYDREVVEQEIRDQKDSGSFIKGTKYKIITTDGKQASIMQAVEKLNDVECRQ
jgi:hypothetical protein